MTLLVDEIGTPAFCCPECRRTSNHPQDFTEGYCGACGWWTSVPGLWLPWAIRRRIAEAGPRREFPPLRCVNDACVELTVCQTVADEHHDPAEEELTFWWCPGCQWNGLAARPRRLGLCSREEFTDASPAAWLLYAPQVWRAGPVDEDGGA